MERLLSAGPVPEHHRRDGPADEQRRHPVARHPRLDVGEPELFQTLGDEAGTVVPLDYLAVCLQDAEKRARLEAAT